MYKDELMAAQQAPAFEKGKLFNLKIIHIKLDPDHPHKYIYLHGAPRENFQAVVGKTIPITGFL
jgi:hypothetical protein